MNKFDRVISTLILLQSGSVITASAIAQRYDISLRTVYRDIATLKNAGVPIIGDPGIGYSLLEGYRLPPMSFNEGETAALLTAEKLIGKMTDPATQEHYTAALTKIRSILRSYERETIDFLDDSIIISNNENSKKQSYLQTLLKSIPNKNLVQINYQKTNGVTSERIVEPVGCYNHYNNWYLMAYCQLKEDYRTFKLDRITQLSRMQQQFDRAHISLKDYIDQQDQSWKQEHNFHTIIVEFNRIYAHHAERRKHYLGFVEQIEMEDSVQITFSNPSLELFARWLMQFGDQATVISPPELQDRIKDIAIGLYRHIS